jgi:hypothetical protein
MDCPPSTHWLLAHSLTGIFVEPYIIFFRCFTIVLILIWLFVSFRWRPQTHTFHLPFGEMTITLEDAQKILGLHVSGNLVTGPCESSGWMARVEAFLGRDLPDEDGADSTARVWISWLRQFFGVCLQYADEDIVQYYCRAKILHLFACVLFPDATEDCVSWI